MQNFLNEEDLKSNLIKEGLQLNSSPKCKCKVCSKEATLFEIIDFNRACLPQSYPFGLSGIPIYYYRCNSCGLLFTNAFDNFTSEGWVKYVYNNDYFSYLDLDYKIVRPQLNAEVLRAIASFLGKDNVIGVDYGGGNGSLASMMREKGFDYFSHDPYDYSDIPKEKIGKFNLVSSYEVLEHTADPIKTFKEMFDLAGSKVVFVLSTQCSHGLIDIDKHLCWNYVSPRNGHVSIYTNEVFLEIARKFSLQYLPVSRGLHLMGKGINLLPLKYAAGLIKLKQRIESKF